VSSVPSGHIEIPLPARARALATLGAPANGCCLVQIPAPPQTPTMCVSSRDARWRLSAPDPPTMGGPELASGASPVRRNG
jgi:hypothetical protein